MNINEDGTFDQLISIKPKSATLNFELNAVTEVGEEFLINRVLVYDKFKKTVAKVDTNTDMDDSEKRGSSQPILTLLSPKKVNNL